MDLSELKEKIRAANFHPIHIEGTANPDKAEGFAFNGTLEEYLEALRALNKKAIFLATDILEEEDFFHEMRERSYDEDNEPRLEIEEIDLCLIKPSISNFKKNIDAVGGFKLFSSLTNDSLDFFIQEDWWLEFMIQYVEAVEEIKNEKEKTHEKLKEAEKEREKILVKSLRELIKNSEFSSLKTQRAMTNYALENIPNLDNLDQRTIKDEIQKLFDKLRR